MGLFRPYEQGASKKAEPTEETVTEVPGSDAESSPSSATAAAKHAPKPSPTDKAQRSDRPGKGHHMTAHKAPATQPTTSSRHAAKKGPTPTRAEAEAARRAAQRREALSAAFEGDRLVIPAGGLKVRSNDCDYVFRPHSAFAHLTGLGGGWPVLATAARAVPRGARDRVYRWVARNRRRWAGTTCTVPSPEHVGMTVAVLRQHGVEVDDSDPNRWAVAPGPIRGR